MKLYEVNGTYGSYKTPCTVFVAEVHHGCWYVVEGSKNINFTPQPELSEGVNVERVIDTDIITAGPIESLEDLERVLEEN